MVSLTRASAALFLVFEFSNTIELYSQQRLLALCGMAFRRWRWGAGYQPRSQQAGRPAQRLYAPASVGLRLTALALLRVVIYGAP